MASSGDMLIVKANFGSILLKMYPNYLDDKGSKDVLRLRGGHYQIVSKENKDSAIHAPIESENVAVKAVDKSMQNKARRKAKG